jgi:lactoylglutathione lyase
VTRIHHVALWTHDLERLKKFYTTYFGGRAREKYSNPLKKYESYFVKFDSGAAIEIMQRPDIPPSRNDIDAQFTGYIHLSLAVGSSAEVDRLTKRLMEDGYRLVDGPRQTGDGYYESVVLDPDGNRVEINAAG